MRVNREQGPDQGAQHQQNIQARIAWLSNVRAHTLADRVRVEATWRKPLALVRWESEQVYVDTECVVLDYVPVPDLPIVSIDGLSSINGSPGPGWTWRKDDLQAAVAVLAALARMDEQTTPAKPLLGEIQSIDVANFNGRKNSRLPHILLYTKNRTEITWGAEMGAWAQYLEATDEDKLAKLYGYYEEFGTLLKGAKYINLRDPRDKIPLPIDKY